MPTVLLLAAADSSETSLGTRLLVFAVCLAVGVYLVYSGLKTLRTGVAEETGVRRGVNAMAGRSNTYTGGTARFVGIMRLVMAAIVLVFGVVFLFAGAWMS